MTNEDDIKSHIISFFSFLYTTYHKRCALAPTNSSLLFFIGLTPYNFEIKEAIFSMKGLKSLRPDGFQPIFFQKNWIL